MCSVKTPKPQPIQEKKPVYLANPYLDSPLFRSAAVGRNSLRIDQSSAPRTPVNPNPVFPPPSGVTGPGLGIGTPPQGDTGGNWFYWPGRGRVRLPDRSN